MTAKNNNKTSGGAGRKPLKLIGVTVVVVAIALTIVWLKVVRGGQSSASELATFVAKRGPLTISVLESGTIQSREQEIIKNEVEGRTSIVYLIPEGTAVKEGELLVELDASTLEDRRIDQEISVQKAEAAYINAKESLAIVKNQAISDVNVAELTLKFAKQDLDQYLQGQYPNDETAAENRVKEAEETLVRAQQTLTWSETLFKEKYIAQTELQADQLAVTRSENSLEVAQNDLKLLQDFTKQRNIDQLTSDVQQAEMALERAEAKARADVVQAEADLKAKVQEDTRQKDKLAKLVDQLDKTRIIAPNDGMVIYATTARRGGFRDNRQPLDEGVEVFERQDLIYLPTAQSAMVEVDIHEASLEKVRLGLPAIVTVDALPGKRFVGTVGKIAPLPDPQSMWMNPDLKVYESEVYLEGEEPDLRTGMSCKVEIVVAQHEDAVYIPVHAVVRIAGQPTAYVVKDGVLEQREVEIGLDNNRMVRIIKGIQEGEVVSLTPPLRSATVEDAGTTLGGAISGSDDGSDSLQQRINRRLEEANGAPAGRPGAPADRGAGPGQGPAGAEGFQPPSAGQMEQMRRRFENMSPEERQKEMERLRQRFENMSPEEREKARQQFQRGGRRQGGGPGQGGDPGQGGGPRPRGGPGQGGGPRPEGRARPQDSERSE